MQERQIDLSAQVARVKRKTRPWKSIIALLLAIAVAVISRIAHHASDTEFTGSHLTNQIVANGAAGLFLIFGSTATYGLAGKSRQLLEPKAGTPHAAIVRYAILIVGGLTTLVVTLWLFGVPVSQLLLSGAVTSVFVGIAAQQALGNVFAGMVLVFARPFVVGEAIRLRAGALGGTLDGTVTDIGITYVRLDTGRQRDVHPELAGAERRDRSHPAGRGGRQPGPGRRGRQVGHAGRPGAAPAQPAGTRLNGKGPA